MLRKSFMEVLSELGPGGSGELRDYSVFFFLAERRERARENSRMLGEGQAGHRVQKVQVRMGHV